MGRIHKAILDKYNERKELGLITQKELAALWKCSQSMISNLLAGNKKGGLTAERIEIFCDHFGMTLADLESLRPSPKPSPTAASNIICDEHRQLHYYFEELLHKGKHRAAWIAGNVITFYSEMTGTPPDLSASGKKPNDDSPLDSGRIFTANGKELGRGRR